MSHWMPTIAPPPFTNQQIIEWAESLSRQHARCVDPQLALLALTFDSVYEEIIYPAYEIAICEDVDLGVDADGNKVLGAYDAEANVAYIDKILHPRMKDPRRVFTLWHEVAGHGVLQGKWLRSELKRLRAHGLLRSTEESLRPSTTNVLERQANFFAARAAAPDWFLLHVLHDTFDLTRPIRFIGRSRYTFSVRGHSIQRQIDSLEHLHRFMAQQVQFRFGWLSIESLSYRIGELQSVINDLNKPSWLLHRVAKATTYAPSIDRLRFGNLIGAS